MSSSSKINIFMTLEYGVLCRTHKVPIIKLVKFFAVVMNKIKKNT